MNKDENGDEKIIYFIKCSKYRKFKDQKISYILNKTLVLFIICGKCRSNDKKTFNEKYG